MTHRNNIAMLAAALLLAAATCAAQPATITILHVNDTHSNLLPNGPRAADLSQSQGGIARAASVVGVTRAADPEALLLHAGDFAIGDVFYNAYYGVPEITIMNMLGFTAMTLGNHEFDLTPMGLLGTLGAKAPAFPLLSANLTLKADAVKPLAAFVTAHTTVKAHGHKIGIFGLTTPAANLLSLVQPDAYVEETIGEIAAAEVQKLTADTCDVVILLSHLGMQLDQMIGTGVPGITAIVGGHDHLSLTAPVTVKNPLGADVPIVQAKAFYRSIGKLQITLGGGAPSVAWTNIPLDNSIPEAAPIVAALDPLKAGIAQTFHLPFYTEKVADITETLEQDPGDLLAQGPHDTPAANLITDAFRDFTHTDIAMTACGSVSQPLYKGPVTAADIFRMIGYGYNTGNKLGYRVLTFDVPGVAVIAGIEYGLAQIEGTDDFLAQGSGLTFVYSPSGAPSSRLLPGEPRVGGVPIDPLRTYSVTANEFVYSFIKMIMEQVQLGAPANVRSFGDTTEFHVVSNYLRAHPQYAPVRRNGVVAPVRGVDASPAGFSLRNSPNPVRTVTDISFALPERAAAALAVYSIDGRKVAEVAIGVYDAGVTTVRFDASQLAPGVYLCTLTAGARSASKTLLKIR